jgi:hypothetical protein
VCHRKINGIEKKGNRIMLDTRIILSGIWITVMLIYLLGDVLRIYSGDYARMAEKQQSTRVMWLGAAILMLIPILMVFLTLVLPQPINRWANLIVAVGFFLFVLVDLRSYPSAYDKFLLIVSLVFNGVTVLSAWNWS